VKSWPYHGSVGYLRVVEIALPHSRQWGGTLVVTAAAALIAGSASPALAQAGGARPAPTTTVEAKPLPSAGWHGQPIRRPYEARSSQPTTAQPPDGAAMRLRAGYGRADGSAPVRRLRRMLLGLGYGCGPADGWFGPRTEASVQWLQIKHGLSPTGVADAKARCILRSRDGLAAGADRRAAARSSVIASPPAWPRTDVSPTQYDERHNGPGVVRSVLLALAVDAGLDTSTHDGRLVAGRLPAAARNGGAHDARRTAPRRRRADTRNGSLDKRDEPIAAPLAPQAPVALIGWTR
jgi:peptidoglycan hydrolase-like protein with peptidoglycan-binding domain